MKRWHNKQGRELELPEVDAFLEEIEAVCRKHGISISHEDSQGAFELESFSEDLMAWLKEASDAREATPDPA